MGRTYSELWVVEDGRERFYTYTHDVELKFRLQMGMEVFSESDENV